jgi:hypothetical protein
VVIMLRSKTCPLYPDPNGGEVGLGFWFILIRSTLKHILYPD